MAHRPRCKIQTRKLLAGSNIGDHWFSDQFLGKMQKTSSMKRKTNNSYFIKINIFCCESIG